MTDLPTSDQPIVDPDNDLLGARVRAHTLAGHVIDIPAPLTIGVYGQWGEGKTSFVNLLEGYLAEVAAERRLPPIKFIRFSAWGHSTSDAVWRALVLKIAQELYGVPDPLPANDQVAPEPEQADQPDEEPGQGHRASQSRLLTYFKEKGWGPRLLAFLNQEAYLIHAPPPPPDPLQDYKEVVARLDRTAAASVGKGPAQRSQLDQEMALLALVQTAVSAMSVLSPLAAAARSLFNVGEKVDLAELLQKEKGEAARETIQSVQEFKHEFHTLFEKKAQTYHQVYVFVDDLDRCMPDVALDVLEAIKIFLGDEKCMFVVAADEQLVGQGLRLRFKDLLAHDPDQRTQAYFEQKGKEYFEKIIQLGVRVPQRGPMATQRFVAAQFPMWTVATDLIQIAAGTNPRRLKQHCHQLSYQHKVAQSETAEPRDGSAPTA